jgi:lipopolysaccharide transport system ATP-binding protein
MSNSIIQVRNLGKSYDISHEGVKGSYTALRDVVANKAKKIFSFPKSFRNESLFKKASTEEFWALKDVSFDIQQGDRVGIIGRNGAGKSTLLKILSRITEPTTGEIRIKGRVASLLEVGTGFHPELTGRENIYLNGAILGMSRSEIKRKFDEIVDFAEVEKFLDTPVKRYSSGMYIRLAFAVAAHLEPEILVVDEVLAVGDAQFQKKCLGKMEDVSKNEGRTVLFVSHNMGAIKSLCQNGLLLINGQNKNGILSIGQTVLNYTNDTEIRTAARWEGQISSSDNLLSISCVYVKSEQIKTGHYFINDMPLELFFEYKIFENHKCGYRFVISICTEDDIILLSSAAFIESYNTGDYELKIQIPAPLLNKNKYKVLARVDIPGNTLFIEETEFLRFEISEMATHSYGVCYGTEPYGYFHLPLKYTIIERN